MSDEINPFQGETDPTRSPNIHIFLPSGIAVIGIDSWVERFTKIFQNIASNQGINSSNTFKVSSRSYPPNVIPLRIRV